MSIPLGGFVFAFEKISGYLRGHSTASFRLSFISCRPPISSHFTSGTSTKTSRIAEAPTSFMASMKSSMVTSNSKRVSYGISANSKSILGRIFLKEVMAASRAKASKSAPTNPWVIEESFSKSTSSERGIPRL